MMQLVRISCIITMLLLWLLLLVTVSAGQINESIEDTTPNTTTLYPVSNKTTDITRTYSKSQQKTIETGIIIENNTKENNNEKYKIETAKPMKERVTTWKIEANYAEPEDKKKPPTYAYEQSKEISAQSEDKESQGIYVQPKDDINKAIATQTKDKKSKDSNAADSKEEASYEKSKNYSNEKEFKPSPHLGSFFDEENLTLLKFKTSDPSIVRENKPTTDFMRSNNLYLLNYKSPKDTYRDQIDAPYRFESASFLTTNNWKQTLESKPTVESSVKIPAGGLYKHSDPFKENSNAGAEENDFIPGLYEDDREKENPVKKRSNPWKKLIHLVTALLPVGLIISALTPNVITLQNTDNNPYLNRVSRRSGAGLDDVPAISESCRRRLLCEIHSEENYVRTQDNSRHVRKHCYKLRCEEPQTLRRVLAWLLAHRPGARPRPLPPHEPFPGPHV